MSVFTQSWQADFDFAQAQVQFDSAQDSFASDSQFDFSFKINSTHENVNSAFVNSLSPSGLVN